MSKRSAPLIPLSHEHHKALFVCMGLRRATAETASEQRDEFLEFWSEHGEPHFRREEEVLFSGFTEHCGEQHPLVDQALDDHRRIRASALALESEPNPEARFLHELGERLDAHVRLEERKLFPLIEHEMPAKQLEGMAAALAADDGANSDAATDDSQR